MYWGRHIYLMCLFEFLHFRNWAAFIEFGSLQFNCDAPRYIICCSTMSPEMYKTIRHSRKKLSHQPIILLKRFKNSHQLYKSGATVFFGWCLSRTVVPNSLSSVPVNQCFIFSIALLERLDTEAMPTLIHQVSYLCLGTGSCWWWGFTQGIHLTLLFISESLAGSCRWCPLILQSLALHPRLCTVVPLSHSPAGNHFPFQTAGGSIRLLPLLLFTIFFLCWEKNDVLNEF